MHHQRGQNAIETQHQELDPSQLRFSREQTLKVCLPEDVDESYLFRPLQLIEHAKVKRCSSPSHPHRGRNPTAHGSPSRAFAISPRWTSHWRHSSPDLVYYLGDLAFYQQEMSSSPEIRPAHLPSSDLQIVPEH